MNQPLLSVNNLTHLYAPGKGFSDVSFDLWPGEVLGIVGESGVKNRRRHALPFRQRFAQTASAPGLLPGFRRHSGSRFKQPM